MDQRRTLIRDFEREIVKKQDQIKNLYIETGQHVFENHKKESRQIAQEDYDNAKKELDKQDKWRNEISRIKEIEERLTEIREQHKAVAAEIETVERANLPIYEKLGEAVFLLYHQNPGRYVSYREIFSELESQVNELENIDKDILNIQDRSAERKFFEKIADKGQLAYLKSVRLVRSRGFARIFTHVGKQLLKTDFVSTSGDAEVKEIAEPYEINRKRTDELDARKTELESEKEKLTAELNNLGVEGRPERRILEIEKLVSESKEKFGIKMESVGVKARTEAPEAIAKNDTFSGLVKRIEENEKKIEQYRENITKLEAAIEVDNLVKQMGRMRQAIGDYEQRIKEHQTEIRRLEAQIAEAEEEKDKYEKIRGPEDIVLHS